jgi:hypothetical protein
MHYSSVSVSFLSVSWAPRGAPLGSDHAIFKRNSPKNIHFETLETHFHPPKCLCKALSILLTHNTHVSNQFAPFSLYSEPFLPLCHKCPAADRDTLRPLSVPEMPYLLRSQIDIFTVKNLILSLQIAQFQTAYRIITSTCRGPSRGSRHYNDLWKNDAITER